MILIILVIAVLFLSYSNGANDNFKGVATLFGSKTTSYKKAISWASVTTFAGSIAAIFLAQTLVKNFSGKGLVPDELIQNPDFAISIALGAALTVFIATKIGMPISTTHALVGGLFGSGVMAIGTAFNFAKLGNTFLMPLIVSPLIAASLSLMVYFIFRKARIALGVTKESCVCVSEKQTVIQTNDLSLASSLNNQIEFASCKKVTSEFYEGTIFGITAQKVLDALHFLSSGVVSFARGLNDTPKIVGLLVVVNAFNLQLGMFLVAIVMVIGGLLNAKKVGVLVSKKITPMNHGQGFTANIITGLLVTTASIHGLPVSTTHVSVGSIFGIGTATKKADKTVIYKILLSWCLTLPIAAFLSAFVYWIIN